MASIRANTAVSIAVNTAGKSTQGLMGAAATVRVFHRAPLIRAIETTRSVSAIVSRLMLSRRMLGLDGKPECGLRVSKQKDRPKAAFSEVMGRESTRR
jgi:hypothetical protein